MGKQHIVPTHMKVDYSPDDESRVRMVFLTGTQEWVVDVERTANTTDLAISLVAHLLCQNQNEDTLQSMYSWVRSQLGLEI